MRTESYAKQLNLIKTCDTRRWEENRAVAIKTVEGGYISPRLTESPLSAVIIYTEYNIIR